MGKIYILLILIGMIHPATVMGQAIMLNSNQSLPLTAYAGDDFTLITGNSVVLGANPSAANGYGSYLYLCRVGKWENKKIGYKGYMKLAYLHPNYFVPDLKKVYPSMDKPFFLIRLSGLAAHHDMGIKGIQFEFLDRIISQLEKYGTVIISSEKVLPEKYNTLLLDIPVSDIHHYLYYSSLLICDSQSMTMEAAMLGTPGIRISDFAGHISVLEELEHNYGLTFGYKPVEEEAILDKLNELLSTPGLKEEFQNRRHKMLSEKIDVTAFLVDFIENHKSCVKISNDIG